MYGTLAGLFEKGEEPEQALKRELFEEIGAKVVSCALTDKAGFSSVGVSDELVVLYEAEIKLSGTQHLEDTENINIKIVKLNDVLKFVEENNFCLISELQIKNFYYKNKKQD